MLTIKPELKITLFTAQLEALLFEILVVVHSVYYTHTPPHFTIFFIGLDLFRAAECQHDQLTSLCCLLWTSSPFPTSPTESPGLNSPRLKPLPEASWLVKLIAPLDLLSISHFSTSHLPLDRDRGVDPRQDQEMKLPGSRV